MSHRAPAGAALLVVAAAVSQEVGAAFAVGLFAAVGTVGALFARFAVASAILCTATRPAVRGLSGGAWGAAVALAATLTVMNFCFYLAIDRIPLGVAVTIEALGPLVLSVVTGKRLVAWLWAALALAGVALLGLPHGGTSHFEVTGFVFAAAAGLAWAGYILASARAGAEFDRVDGLAIATAMGALAVAPFAFASVSLSEVNTHVLVVGIAVGVLSSVVPYSLELLSLRHLPPATFAVLTCLSPVTAALAGLVVLGQQIGAPGYLGVGLVTVASIGAVRSVPRASLAIGGADY